MDKIALRTGGIAVIGFGEAARAFVAGWQTVSAGPYRAFDIQLDAPETRPVMSRTMQEAGVTLAASPQEALAGAEAVFSLVTPDQAVAASRAGAPWLRQGALWLDCNSCAPNAKREAAAFVTANGGRYVDIAVMAAVRREGHRVPLLLSGSAAAEAADRLRRLGMRPRVISGEVGLASMVKMLRSVMIKGFEALTAECLLAARKAGVETAVLESLQASDPGFDWTLRSAYNLERMAVHGVRRAAEMREVARTVRDLGLSDRMATATADWQHEIGSRLVDLAGEALDQRADAILAALDRG